MSDSEASILMQDARDVEWQRTELTSPYLARPVSVVAAKDVPYIPNANRLQNLSIYPPKTPETSNLIGTPASSLPSPDAESLPRYHLYVRSGAWRDPQLTSRSIEPTVAHTFSATDSRLIRRDPHGAAGTWSNSR
jgi:kynurenine formamidase